MVTRSAQQPPFSPEQLADFHADNLPPELNQQLKRHIDNDESARRYIQSLDELCAQLARLPEHRPILHPMPQDVAQRLDDFARGLHYSDPQDDSVLTALPPHDTRISRRSQRPHKTRRPRTMRRVLPALAVAATVFLAAIVTVALLRTPTEKKPTPLSSGELTPTIALQAMGRHTVSGYLAEPAHRAECVRAAGLDRPVLGATDMTFRGRPAVLILVGGTKPGALTALAVGPSCRLGDPQLLALTPIG